MPTDVGIKIRPSTDPSAVEFHADQVTIDGVLALIERVKLSFGDPGSALDVSAAHPLPITVPSGTVPVSATSPLPISIAADGDVASTLTDGRKTVTTPGTAVALAVSSACKWVTVTALLTNTQQVNVGGSGTLATLGGSTGSPLLAGDSVTIPVNDPSKVFVDARVSGEGVSFTVGS